MAASETSFDAIVAVYYKNNIHNITRIWKNWRKHRSDIEDDIQQCFVKLLASYRNAERQPKSEREIGWLFNVVIANHLQDKDRAESTRRERDRTRQVVEFDWAVQWQRGHDELPNLEPVDRSLDVEETLRLEELLHNLIQEMGEEFGDTLVMLFLEGRTPQEIGAHFGVDGYSRVRWTKAKLSKILQARRAAGDYDAVLFEDFCGKPAREKAKRGLEDDFLAA